MTKQDRAARTRLALVRSAATIFEARGYVRTSLSEISAGAGVSCGALHFHFPNKAALAEAVELAAARALLRVASRGRRGDACALQRLIDVSHGFARLLRDDVVVRAGLRLNMEAGAGRALDLRWEWWECVHALLAEAEQQGSLAADLPPHRASALILVSTTGLEALSHQDRGWLSAPSLTGLWRLLLPRIAAPHRLGTLDPSGSEPDQGPGGGDGDGEGDGEILIGGLSRAGLALR